MSLLSYSSPWTSDNTENQSSNGAPKKRTPTLGGIQSAARKTIKNRSTYDNGPEQYESAELVNVSEDKMVNMRGNPAPESIDEYLDKQTDRNTKINSILNKITSFSTDNRLGDFNPMPYPTTLTKKNADQPVHAEEAVNIPANPLMPKISSSINGIAVSNATTKPNPASAYYRPTESNGPQYASYRDAYGKEGLTTAGKEPYYSKMGISGSTSSGDKMMDRLNYMTQMLESMQMEKTNHITEEFVLYSLLGVFMIYIVDGFSRGGKYVR